MLEFKRTAFTLAEVLITLGIIGVVAAMTIPTVVGKYQKKVIATQLKTVYGELEQAFNSAKVDNGDSKYWATSFQMGDGEQYQKNLDNFLETYLFPYLKHKYVKGKHVEIGYPEFTGTLSDPTSKVHTLDTQFIKLANGPVINVSFNNDGTIFRDLLMYVDVNGMQKPNIIGKDIFLISFLFSTGKLQFYGTGASKKSLLNLCGKSAGGDQYCGALILMDGWEIKDDYPW